LVKPAVHALVEYLALIAGGLSSVYVSFYKDIGVCGGAALIGDENFIRAAKVWRTRLGGLFSEHWVCRMRYTASY